MKKLKAFIKKEFHHIFRDTRSMLILFGIPVTQLLIFGTVIKNEISDVPIAIYDESKDEVTSEIISKIRSSGYFILHENLESLNTVDLVLKKGHVKEVIVFESRFSQNLFKEGKANIQLIADASDPNLARLVTSYTTGIINDYIQKINQHADMPLQIQPEVRMLFNEEMKSSYQFVPGTMALILMLVSALMTSVSITKEKETGTMEILLASPLRPFQIIVGKVLPYLLLSVINAFVIIFIGITVFGVPIAGSFSLLLLETILFISMALCLGIFISTVAKSQMIAMFISLIALMLPTIILSGFIFPIENMPKILQIFSYIMPARYFIEIIRSIMLKGTGMQYIWQETAVIAGMLLLLIAASVKRFKVRLE